MYRNRKTILRVSSLLLVVGATLLIVLDVLLRNFPGMICEPPAPPVLRVLAIGNSFSEDAVEHDLYDVAKAANVDMVIGNLYIGGCSLERHAENARANAPAYRYTKIVNGVPTVKQGVSLEEALTEEPWDFVTLQQASPLSGQYDSYAEYLPALVEYVKSLVTNAGCQLALHQTWAYERGAAHPGFAHYGSDQLKMYEAIVDANRRAAELAGIGKIIPSGTAIQNMRGTVMGDRYCSDGYHLNDYGRYVAACVWMEALTGVNVVHNPYEPDYLILPERILAQCAAHLAVLAPYEVSSADEFLFIQAATPARIQWTETFNERRVESGDLRVENGKWPPFSPFGGRGAFRFSKAG